MLSRYGVARKDDSDMEDKQAPAAWGLSQELMAKSLELAFEDPALAVRLANLAVRASLYLREAIDPHAAHEAFHRARWRQDDLPRPQPARAASPRRDRRRKAS
jgi:hypothetical protein